MVDRDRVECELRDGLELLETGDWFIAEGSYGGQESAAQGESREEAIDKLVSKVCKRVNREERFEEERERFGEQMENYRELADT